MNFINGLKRICDICFAMTFATVLGGFIGAENLIITLPIFAVVAFLGVYLATKGWLRLLSLLPLASIWLFVDVNIPTLVVLVPAVIYLIVLLTKPVEESLKFEYEGVFKVFIGIFGWILFFVVITSTMSTDTITLPMDSYLFGISFILNAIVLSRMIRHDAAVFKTTKFKILNAAPLILVVVGAIILSNDSLWMVVRNILGFVFTRLIIPVAEFFALIIVTIIAFFGRLIFPGGAYLGEEFPGEDVILTFEQPPMTWYDIETETASTFAIVLAILIIAGIFIFLVFIMIRMFMNPKLETVTRDDGVEETRTALATGISIRRRFRSREENKIRKVYREFLALITKNEVVIPLSSTSSDVEHHVQTKFGSSQSAELRAEYVRVRYGEAEYNKNDVSKVKNLLKNFKDEIKENG